MHEKDANVRRVEMKAIIRLVAKKVVGTWENALAPRCGVAYTEKELKKNVVGDKRKIAKFRK